jgi:hypothetical protein
VTAIRGALGDATSVVRHGLVLLWQYWPTLLTIFLFGQAVRAAALWAAMKTTTWSGLAGFLLVPIAPLAVVSALILALRVLAPSLRWANFQAPPTDEVVEGEGGAGGPGGGGTAPAEQRTRRRGLVEDRLALLSATLIPFFAVYAAQGYLKEDTRQFLNETAADEFKNNADFWLEGGSLNLQRVLIPEGWLFWATVALAFALRWGIDRLGLPRRHMGWGWLAAYIEVAWVALFARVIANKFGEWVDWLKNRQAAVSTQSAYEGATSSLGTVGDAIDKVVGFVTSAIGQADAIIIVPMAWLTVGAVVYGRSLSQRRAESASESSSAWAKRIEKVPGPVRRVGAEVFAGPIDRFKGLAGALRTFARAGLAPMLLFCLVFVLASQVETGVAWLLTRAVGPLEPSLAEILTPYAALLTRGAYTVVTVALLAAAIDRILRPDPAEQDEVAAPESVPA